MKKTLALILVVCFMLSMSAVGFADQGNVAAISPFSDVPQNSWAYSAVLQLQKDGVVQGDGGKFNGNQTLTRYEVAQMIAGAMTKLRSEMSAKGAALIAAVPQPGQTPAQAAEAQAKLNAAIANISKQDRALIQKLAAEFAAELDAMGVKVDAIGSDMAKIEARIDKMPKMSWAAQIQVDPQVVPTWNGSSWDNHTNPNTLLWLSPMVSGTIDGNWAYYGEVRFNAPLMNGMGNDPAGSPLGNSYKGVTSIDIRNAYAYGNMIGAKWYVGRMEDNLPFTNVAGRGGLITDSRIDGVRVAMDGGAVRGDIFAGFDTAGYGLITNTMPGATGATNIGNKSMITGVDAAYTFVPGANAYLGYYLGWAQNNSASSMVSDPFSGVNNPQQFFELGLDYQLTPKVTATAYAAASAGAPTLVGQKVADSFGQGQNLSWLARLDYGTFDRAKQGSMNLYGMYARTGANSVWGQPNYDVSALTCNASYKNGDTTKYAYGMNGNAQGFEVGLDWAPIQNVDWHFSWSNTTAISPTLAQAQINSQLGAAVVTAFDGQRNIYKSELTFMF